MRTAKISVIIPVYNAKKYLRTCLDSVLAAIDAYGNAELVLVDNGSTDGSYEILKSEYAARPRIYQLKGVTISALRNHGARVTQGDYLSFIDSDCVIPRDYFQRAAKIFEGVQAEATGCYYSLPAFPSWIEETWHGINWRPVDTFVPYLFSGNFIIKRSAFEKVGGFNEKLITGEDAEIGLRLNVAGFRIYASHEVVAVHLGNAKTLGEFFSKHTWHALGMFGGLKWTWGDRPLIMTFFHVVLTALGVTNILLPWTGIVSRIGVFVLLTGSVTIATVAYRSIKKGKTFRPLRCVFLYYVYYWARVWALFKLIGFHGRGRLRPSDLHPERS